MVRYYTSTCSSKTPSEAQRLFKELSAKLSSLEYVCRTGDALGCDTVDSKDYEIYRADKSIKSTTLLNTKVPDYIWRDARDLAIQLHPGFTKLSDDNQTSYIQNLLQVTGIKKKLSSFVICWTEDGAQDSLSVSKKTGRVGWVIKVAEVYNIPVYNLRNQETLDRLTKWLSLLTE